MSDTLSSLTSIVSIFHSLPGVHLVVKPESSRFAILEVTDSFLNMTGLEREIILGTDLADFFSLHTVNSHSEGLQDLAGELSGVFNQKKPTVIPSYFRFNLAGGLHACGETYWRISISPVADEDGEVNALILFLENATAKVLIESREKQAREELELKARLLQKAESAANLGSWETDLVNGKMSWSDECFRICGLEPQCFEPTMENRKMISHPDDWELVRTQLQDAIKTGADYRVQSRILRPDGSIRVVMSEGKVIRNTGGGLEKLIGISRDITTNINTRDILKASEEKYRTVFHLSPLPKWIFDLETLEFLEVNQAAVEHYGYSMAEFLNMTVNDIRSEEDLNLFMPEMNNYKKFSNKLSGPFRHRKKNGELMLVEITGVRVDYGLKKAMLIISNDITEKLQYEQALLKSNDRYLYAMKASSDAIWDWDLAKGTIYWSESYKKLFGHPVDNFFSSSGEWQEHIHPDDKSRVLQSIDDALGSGMHSWLSQYRFRRADGSFAHVVDRGTIMKNDQGDPYRMVGAMQDITRQKTEEQEREKLIDELTRTNNDLQQFSYITSHNLKAPLANLLGILSLLDTSTIHDPETLALIDGLERSTRQLNQTVNDLNSILVVKRNINSNISELSLEETWKSTEKLIHGLCKAAGAIVITEFTTVPTVSFNKTYLESIFLNLVSNALKYRSQHRKLRIVLSSTEKDGSVVLTVSDNGSGIDLARHGEKIFGLYQRFHYGTEGRGLGLYMVASQLQSLGGRIEVESQVDKGTSFKVIFPKSRL